MVIKSGIYKILNILNGKFYIGSTANLRRRKNSHFNKLKKGVHVNRYLQNAYNKYGKDNFEFSVIEYVEDVEKLLEREQYYIDREDFNAIYNINPVAGSSLGRKLGPVRKDVRVKISRALSGDKNPNYEKKLSLVIRNKISISNRGNKPNNTSFKVGHKVNVGRKASKNTRDKISKSNTGKIPSKETRKKMSEARKGRVFKNNKVIDGIEYFECSRCKKFLSKESFYKHKINVCGISSMCKRCDSEYKKDRKLK